MSWRDDRLGQVALRGRTQGCRSPPARTTGPAVLAGRCPQNRMSVGGAAAVIRTPVATVPIDICPIHTAIRRTVGTTVVKRSLPRLPEGKRWFGFTSLVVLSQPHVPILHLPADSWSAISESIPLGQDDRRGQSSVGVGTRAAISSIPVIPSTTGMDTMQVSFLWCRAREGNVVRTSLVTSQRVNQHTSANGHVTIGRKVVTHHFPQHVDHHTSANGHVTIGGLSLVTSQHIDKRTSESGHVPSEDRHSSHSHHVNHQSYRNGKGSVSRSSLATFTPCHSPPVGGGDVILGSSSQSGKIESAIAVFQSALPSMLLPSARQSSMTRSSTRSPKEPTASTTTARCADNMPSSKCSSISFMPVCARKLLFN